MRIHKNPIAIGSDRSEELLMLHDNWKPVGRNDPCPCGSGKKYKHCHMRADREAAQQAKMEAAQRAEEERLAQQAAREAERRDERERLAQLREHGY